MGRRSSAGLADQAQVIHDLELCGAAQSAIALSSSDNRNRMSVPLAASAPDVKSDIAPHALSVLNSVFGLPGFRGAQEEIVRHVTDGGNCLVLMPTGADIEAILQHAHSLGAVIDVSNERNVNNLMPAQGSHPLVAQGVNS